MPGIKRYSLVKGFEWINCTLSSLYDKQEILIKEMNNTSSIISSSIWATILTIPIALIGYIFQTSKIVTLSIVLYIAIIPAYIFLWILCDKKILPFLMKLKNQSEGVDLGHLQTAPIINEFNNIIVNKILLILSMKENYSVNDINSDNLKRLYIIEILEYWGSIIIFIYTRIINNNPEKLVREIRNNNIGIGNIDKYINIYTLYNIVDILFEIQIFLFDQIKDVSNNEQIQNDYDLLCKDLQKIRDYCDKNRNSKL